MKNYKYGKYIIRFDGTSATPAGGTLLADESSQNARAFHPAWEQAAKQTERYPTAVVRKSLSFEQKAKAAIRVASTEFGDAG